MARIEDCGQPHARLQGLNHDSVHFIIDNMSDLSKIDWIDNLVVSIFFVSIEILSLASMTFARLV